MTYTVAEAKNKLPALIKQAEAGEQVIITRRGVPVAEIVQKKKDVRPKPVFGVLGNKKVIIDPDWDKPIEDIEAWMRGEI
ncbi:MAG: type II toxin-antitoxin system prevent-host-death family antitoxin [Acidobacteriaceae bacterium]|nr:type II toxin-antitoxin system prevent-host-death family antitoxin [Acidobacteriaceae bacterium]